MPPEFTEDWFTPRIPNFEEQLLPFAGRPGLDFLELGSAEGRSSVWLLDNVLTHSTSRLLCVDGTAPDSPFGQRLAKNLEPYGNRVDIVHERTSTFLRRLPRKPRFHFGYADAGHLSPYVLEDAILFWPLMRLGSLVIVDDYGALSVQFAMDIFMDVYQEFCKVVFQNWQLGLRKTGDWEDDQRCDA